MSKLSNLSLSDLYGLRDSVMNGEYSELILPFNSGLKEKVKNVIFDEIVHRETEIINEIIESPEERCKKYREGSEWKVCKHCKWFQETHFPIIAQIKDIIADGICHNKNQGAQPIILDCKKDTCNYFQFKDSRPKIKIKLPSKKRLSCELIEKLEELPFIPNEVTIISVDEIRGVFMFKLEVEIPDTFIDPKTYPCKRHQFFCTKLFK